MFYTFHSKPLKRCPNCEKKIKLTVIESSVQLDVGEVQYAAPLYKCKNCKLFVETAQYQIMQEVAQSWIDEDDPGTMH